MNAAIRRRAISRATLLAIITSVLKYRIGGNVMCCQSVADPCRTTRALVKEANVIVLAARPTQIPVLAGGGEYSFPRPTSPSAGTRFRQPPLPDPWLRGRPISAFNGSWIVVAILRILRLQDFVRSSRLCAQKLFRLRMPDYFSSGAFLRSSGEVCITWSLLAPSTLY